MDTNELQSVIESLLLVAESPLRIERLAELLELERSEVRQAIEALQESYRQREAGIEIAFVGNGYQFRTIEQNAEWVRRLAGSRPFRFSRPALETLAIIAYRQPVTRPEIEYLRGVDSGGVLKTLLEKHLVRILGKKDVPGKPLIYGTTRQFLELFGLADLAALPTLKEIADIDKELREAEMATSGNEKSTVEDGGSQAGEANP